MSPATNRSTQNVRSFARTPGWVAVICLAALVSAARTTRAEKAILLQSHSGTPPEDGQYFVDYLIRTFGDEAPSYGNELKALIEKQLSRAAGTPEPPKKMRLQVEEGRRQFIEGEFKEAIRLLEQVRGQLLAQVALVASDQGLRDAMYRALLFLAHAYLRDQQGQPATARVSEAIRSFPDRDLSLVRFGPDLVAFYKKVRRDLDRQQRGSLTINTTPEGCLVFLNERYVGLSPARVVDLYPGMYRVYVQKPQKRGRIHMVNVDGDDSRISIDFDLDRVLTTDPYVGLKYGDVKTMIQSEVKHAASVARALDAPMALVLGFRQYQGRRTLQGTAISSDTGRVIRSGMVALEPAAPSPRTLKALGQFLVAGKENSGIIIRTNHVQGLTGMEPGSSDSAQAQEGGFFSARIFKWITLGVAGAALASGIAFIALDGRGTCDGPQGALCPEKYETMPLGIALTAAGGVAAITSGVLFYLDSSREGISSSSVSLSPMGLTRGAGLSALLRF